jgi:hypothetical protein
MEEATRRHRIVLILIEGVSWKIVIKIAVRYAGYY